MPDCKKCGWVDFILPNNRLTIELIDRYIIYMIDGFGSPNLPSIMEIMRLENISDIRDTLDRLLIYIVSVARELNDNTPVRTYSQKSKKTVTYKSKK